MNYLKARERQSNHRWDYTQMNDGAVWPVGYCAGWKDYTPEERARYCMSDEWLAQHLALKANYHDDGHATADEACECYKRYELDTALRFSTEQSTKRQCEVCKEWTQSHATVGGYTVFVLCEAHANRAEVEKLFSVGESWES